MIGTARSSHGVQARMAAVLAWLAPRSAAVRSLRLRASDSNSGRKDLVSPVSWAQFVPLLNNITNEHDRQLVARKMQPLLMAAWAEPDYPHVQHDYTRYTARFANPKQGGIRLVQPCSPSPKHLHPQCCTDRPKP